MLHVFCSASWLLTSVLPPTLSNLCSSEMHLGDWYLSWSPHSLPKKCWNPLFLQSYFHVHGKTFSNDSNATDMGCTGWLLEWQSCAKKLCAVQWVAFWAISTKAAYCYCPGMVHAWRGRLTHKRKCSHIEKKKIPRTKNNSVSPYSQHGLAFFHLHHVYIYFSSIF